MKMIIDKLSTVFKYLFDNAHRFTTILFLTIFLIWFGVSNGIFAVLNLFYNLMLIIFGSILATIGEIILYLILQLAWYEDYEDKLPNFDNDLNLYKGMTIANFFLLALWCYQGTLTW